MPITSISGPFGQGIVDALSHFAVESGGDIVLENGSGAIISESDIELTPGAGSGACCPETIIEFDNTPETYVLYTQDFINKHGRTPQVEAYYQQVGVSGDIIIAGAYTRKALIGVPTEAIRVNHGGNQSGFLKIT